KAFVGELTKSPSFDELHRDVAIRSNDAGLIDGDDVRMIERRRQRRFPQEPLQGIVLLALIRDEHATDDFQRDVAPEAGVLRPIDLSHAARAKLADDFVRTDT